MRVLVIGLGVAALAASTGCGYRLVDSGGASVPVAVTTLTNDSLEPGVEFVLAAALRREIERTGGLRVVDEPRASGYRVGGRVAAVESMGRTFTPGVRALEYTLIVQLDLAVTGPGGRPVTIDPFAQRGAEIYLASIDLQISRKNREEALRRVAALLAARIRREIEGAVRGETGKAGRPAPSLGRTSVGRTVETHEAR